MYWGKEKYAKAPPNYEKGIEVDPGFDSNYHQEARIYLNSTEEVWRMIYGELFMYIDRNTARTAEISNARYCISSCSFNSSIHWKPRMIEATNTVHKLTSMQKC